MKKCIKIFILVISGLIVLSTIAMAELNDGLIAYYSFNGDASDASGNEYNGTVHGATLTTDRFGRPDSAYSFDGVDDYISTNTDFSWSYTDSFSISLWIKSDNPAKEQVLIGKSSYEYSLRLDYPTTNTASSVHFAYWNSNAKDMIDTSYNLRLNVNQWYHVLLTYNGNVKIAKMYIDGQLVSSDDYVQENFINRSNDTLIGYGYYIRGHNRYFEGSIDEVRIYNRELNSLDFKQLSYLRAGDFDKDGDVDAVDLAGFSSVWGTILNKNPITVTWSWDNIPLGYFCDNWEPNDTDPDRVCTIRRPEYSSTFARISNLKNGQAQIVSGTIDETFMQASSSGAFQFTTGEVLLSNMFDSEWADVLGVNDYFNTVWDPINVLGDFEVISQPDEKSAPSTTMNSEAYFFSYDESNISLNDWVDYLEFVKLNYKRSIDTLVIYAHGNAGLLKITDTIISTSDLQSDDEIRNIFQRLRNILSSDGHILLFSCNTAQDVDFIRELSLLTQAYVHANSNFTGFPEDEAPWFNCASDSDCTDWQLDLVCAPDGSCHYE